MAITLAQAEALTLGTHEASDIVQRLADGYHYDAEDIRNMLLGQRPSAALARFPLEQYQGTYTTDLFGEDATTYFDDVEQLRCNGRPSRPGRRLCCESGMGGGHRALQHSTLALPPGGRRRNGRRGHQPRSSGTVEVLEGLDRHAVTTSTASATADTPSRQT